MTKSFLNFLSKRMQSGFLVTNRFNYFPIRIDFFFKSEITLRAFNARLGIVGTFFMFIKTRQF